MDAIDAEHGFLAHRVLADGTVLTVVPLFGGRGRLCIGEDFYTWDDAW